jgi:hypothetical protein
LQYFRCSWTEVVALYRQTLLVPEADRAPFLQDKCGARSPVYFEVQALLAASEQRRTIVF